MIALMFLIAIAIWLMVVIVLTIFIPRIVKQGWLRIVVRLIVFPALLVAPIADEWIGDRQFKALCERENVVHLSNDWQKVRRAKDVASPYLERIRGYWVRIEKQEVKYQDMDTGELFLYFNIHHNYGGFLMNRMKFRLNASPPNCWPDGASEIYNKIHLDRLINNGEIK